MEPSRGHLWRLQPFAELLLELLAERQGEPQGFLGFLGIG
jgi:hypothetical protein